MDESTPVSRHLDSFGQAFLWTLLPSLALLLIAPPAVSLAQVATNITPTTIAPLDLGTNVDTVGSTTHITGGTRPGSGTNLFHSFDTFTLGTGDVAHFMNDMQLPTNNIFGRVIGGEVSTIDGTLRTNNPLNAADPMNFGAANLWLVNPSGLFLGANARIEVGGSVSMSTANYLRFDGTSALFDMLSSPASLGPLSVAPVAAFGFLGPDLPASITIQGSSLQVPTGQSLSLVGGDITMVGGALTATSGRINLASVASAGEVVFNPPGQSQALNVDSFTQLGQIQMSQGARIDARGNRVSTGAGGTVAIRSGLLTLDDSFIQVGTLGEGSGGTITANVGDLIMSNGAKISSTSTSTSALAGNGGTITIQGVTGAGSPATSVSLLDGGTISTEISGGRAATPPGAITITAQTLALFNAGSIAADTHGAAPAGDITLNVDTLTPAFFSGITSTSDFIDSTAGNAGTITIQGIPGAGSPAAHVSLDNSIIRTTIAGGTSSSVPGGLKIAAQTVNLANSAQISADTHGAAPAGDIAFNVGTLTAANPTGNPDFPTIISSSSLLQDSTAGNAGRITIQGITGSGSPVATVSLDNSTISTTIAGGTSSSIPAAIEVTAQTVNLANGSQIKADTSGAAPAGNIALNVDTLTAAGNSTITSSSTFTDSTAGNAGNITIQGITGSGSPAAHVSLDKSRIGTETFFGGSAANTPATITITAQTLALTSSNENYDPTETNAASIGASTFGAAAAGDITLNVDTLTAGNSTIFSGSFSNDSTAGNAGNITIQGITGSGSPTAHVSLANSAIATVINGGTSTSTPATITITAHTLALLSKAGDEKEFVVGAVIGADTFGAAPAGNIALNVDTLTAGSNSFILSGSSFDDSTAGNAGNITIQGITGSGSPAAHVSLDKSRIGTETFFGGSAANTPATITITAHTLALVNGASIGADTDGAGPAGDITLNVDTLTAGNSIISSSSSVGGNAGSITIQGITGSGSPAAHVSLDHTNISTTISGGSAATTPAAITITAHTLALANDASIIANTVSTGPAGDITLNVGTLTVGSSGSGSPFFSGISSSSFFNDSTAGSAGNITIQGITGSGSPAAHVSLDNNHISTTIAGGTLSSVPANITIKAQSVTLSNGGAITASTTGNAPAGNIGLVTQQLTMTPDSAITSNAQENAQEGGGTTGRAGSITITGAGSAPTTIAGGTIQAQSETSAIAGDITLHAPGDLTLLGTTVSVKNTGPGSAGSITLRAGNDLLMRNTKVSTESAEASGGNIKLTAPNLVRIVDSMLTSSVQGQAGSNGGNINIDPQLVVIQNSQLLANANAGAGGNITIAATGAVLVDPNSRIDASAGPAGVSGSVNINAPIQVLSGTFVPLNLAYSQAELSGDRCAADPTGQFSSFVQTGRDGVPQIPGALSPSPLSFLETLTSGSLGSPSPNWAAARLGLDSGSDSMQFRFPSACRS